MTNAEKSKLWEAYLNVPEDSVLRTDALQCQSEALANKVMVEGTEILTDRIKLAVAERFAKVHESSSIAYKYRVDIGIPKDFWEQVLSFLTISVEPTMPFEELCHYEDSHLTNEWQAFDDDHEPELDREFNIENSPSPESLNVYRIHREGMHLAVLELRLDDKSWKEVDCANAAWLIRNGKWRYANEPEQM